MAITMADFLRNPLLFYPSSLGGGKSHNPMIFIIVFIAIIGLLWIMYKVSQPSIIIPVKNIQYADRIDENIKRIDQIDRPNISLLRKTAIDYEKGTLDSYDVAGHKTSGIKPNAPAALHFYKLAMNAGDTTAIYDIARIMHHGCGDYIGNLDEANRIYKKLLQNNLPDKYKTWIYIQIADIQQLKNATPKFNNPLKPTNLNHVPHVKNNTYNPVILSHQNVPNVQQPVKIADLIRSNNTQFAIGDYDLTIGDDVIRRPGQMYSDAHNTHDTIVNSTIRSAIDNISDTQLTKTKQETVAELRNFIKNYASNDKQKDALMALDAVERNFIPVSNVNKTEVEVLQLVWNRIHDPINKDYTDVLKENLADYLAECVEHGKVCCPTGRINRIADTLNVVDPGVQIKSSNMLNTEIMTATAKIREDVYNELSSDQQKLVDSIDDPTKTTENFKETIKNKLNEKIQTDYIDTKLAKKETLEPMINECIDAL
jgi:TPR repeat protein